MEELYFTGLRLNQFYDADVDPYPYYEEALRRDPGDSRVNTQLGILYCKRKMWAAAGEKLRLALERVAGNYTRPRDGEALYYLGIALRAQKRWDEAYDALYRTTWSAAHHTASYYALAQIDCRRGNYATALSHLDRALTTSVHDLPCLNLRTVVLRRLGDGKAAERQARQVADLDPLDHQCRNELYLLQREAGKRGAAKLLAKLMQAMRDSPRTYLELSLDYANSGCYEEAIDLLARLEERGTEYPMVCYYLGYFWAQRGDEDRSSRYYGVASQLSPDYCFPFRAESIDVLTHAAHANPQDPLPPYYLGNLLYEPQPERAIEAWEKSRNLDPQLYVVHRNLGLAYAEVEDDLPKAIASMERAVALGGTARLLYELDELYEKTGVAPEERYALLRDHHELGSQRSETLLSEAQVAVLAGHYGGAIKLLAEGFFPDWEGRQAMGTVQQDAHILRGLQSLEAGQAHPAREDFETALTLTAGRFGRSRTIQLNFLMGEAHHAIGDTVASRQYYEQAVAGRLGRFSGEYAYYKGRALVRLGRATEAEEVYDEMLAQGGWSRRGRFAQRLESDERANRWRARDLFATAMAHLGKGMLEEARAQFEEALALDPSNIWVRRQLASTGADSQ